MRLDDPQCLETASLAMPSDASRLQHYVGLVTKAYSALLLILFGMLPLAAIIYLNAFQSPLLLFEDHVFHEFAIGVATLEGVFVSYVTWRCYQYSGEPFLRWLTLGFLGFTLIYSPHGLFTGMAHQHMWLFLLYGPASRVLMATCFFIGLLSYGKPPDPAERRLSRDYWWGWIVAFMLINLAVGATALSPLGGHPLVRLSMETGALCIVVLGIVVV